MLKAVDYLDFSVKWCLPQPRPQMSYQGTRRNPSLNVLIALLLLQLGSNGLFGPLPHLTIKFQPLKIPLIMKWGKLLTWHCRDSCPCRRTRGRRSWARRGCTAVLGGRFSPPSRLSGTI